MTNWTPSTIQQKADAIQDMAKQIDAQLWYAGRYAIVQPDAYNSDLKRKVHDLQIAIAEFKNLDTDAILMELQEAIK